MVVSNSDIAKPLPVPIAKELTTHLFETVLELEPDKIKSMIDVGYSKFGRFRNISYDTLAIMRDKDTITISLWQELSDLRMYIDTMDELDHIWVMLMTPHD